MTDLGLSAWHLAFLFNSLPLGVNVLLGGLIGCQLYLMRENSPMQSEDCYGWWGQVLYIIYKV